jgi:hypothetical protein
VANMLNLDNLNVFEREMTVTDARSFIDGASEQEDIVTGWFDEAQGPVATRENRETYLVIKITRD